MINIAKELIKREEEKMMELEKEFNVERVNLAEKFITELRETLVVLKCEYLLEGVKEVVVDNSELEVQIKELKKLNETLKASATKAANNVESVKVKLEEAKKIVKDKDKEIKQLNKTIEDKDKAIKSLEYKLTQDTNELGLDVKDLKEELEDTKKQVEWFKSSASTWQSKYTKLFNETKDVKDESVLQQALKAKDEYIIKLETQLQDKAYQAANDGYVVNGLEVSVNVVNDLNDQINKLQEELAQKERDIELLQQAAICYENTKKQNKVENTKEVVKEVPKDEANKECFALNTNVKFKAGTKLFESDNHYVIAKSSVKDIVVVPKKFNVEVNKQDFIKYEDLLVNKFNFDKDRQVISPVVVEHNDGKHKAFLARTEARESLFVFSYKDVLAGYVVNNYKVYSWSWNPETHEEPFVLDLGQQAKGKRCTVSPCDKKAIVLTIKAMKAQYEEQIKTYCEANELKCITKEDAAKSSSKVNARLNDLFSYQEETDRIAASAVKPQTVVENNNKEVASTNKDVEASTNNNFSASMNDFISEMFC